MCKFSHVSLPNLRDHIALASTNVQDQKLLMSFVQCPKLCNLSKHQYLGPGLSLAKYLQGLVSWPKPMSRVRFFLSVQMFRAISLGQFSGPYPLINVQGHVSWSMFRAISLNQCRGPCLLANIQGQISCQNV